MNKPYPKFLRRGKYLLIRDSSGKHYYYGILAWMKAQRNEREILKRRGAKRGMGA